MNTPVQGTAADIIKIAMVNIREQLPDDCFLLSQVHDELIYEVPEEKAEEYMVEIKRIMEEPYSDIFTIPIISKVGIAASWGEAK